jgi:hypothetical protein
MILLTQRRFEDYYHVHLPILEPVGSLEKLHKDSPALFWAIPFTTSLHHPRHSHLYTQMREPFRLLISTLFTSPVQALKDLQALLIICQWPFEVGYQSEDPSLMHSGFVVNAALHMGLDKIEDEVLFGHRRAKHSLEYYGLKYLRRTWMKIFEISTQYDYEPIYSIYLPSLTPGRLNIWHGLRPQISSASALRSLSAFYEAETEEELIALTEIQRQVARNTISLDDLHAYGPQVSLVYFFIQELGSIRERFATVWSRTTEISLQGAKLLVFAHCLLLAGTEELGTTQGSDTDYYITSIFQQGHSAALALIQAIQDSGMASIADPPCASRELGGAPLLAHPKQHFRLAFFACVFLLTYLDCARPTTSMVDQDTARNAVSTVHQIFNQFRSRAEIIRAAHTIEVLGRAVVPGQKRIKTVVKMRMGASLSYNAIWAAATLRGREFDPEYTTTMSAAASSMNRHIGEHAPNISSTATAGNELPCTGTPFGTAVEPPFPWGLWNDAIYDELGWDAQLFPGLSSGMNPF